MALVVQVTCLQVLDDGESGWQGAQMFKLHFQPDIIFASSRTDPSLLDELKEPYEAIPDEPEDEQDMATESSKAASVRLEKASLFSLDQVSSQVGFFRWHFKLACFCATRKHQQGGSHVNLREQWSASQLCKQCLQIVNLKGLWLTYSS